MREPTRPFAPVTTTTVTMGCAQFRSCRHCGMNDLSDFIPRVAGETSRLAGRNNWRVTESLLVLSNAALRVWEAVDSDA